MSKRLTTEEFIARGIEVHSDKYRYENTKYISAHEPVIVTCDIHGDFETRPANFLSGKGCRKCGRTVAAAKIIKDKSEFVNRATEKHNGKYDYSKLEYKGMQQEGVIICPEHGEFRQTLNNHLKNGGCKHCGLEVRSAARTLPIAEVLKRAELVHGGRYDYSKVDYKGAFSKIEIICNEHGSFYQTPDRHLAGNGCAKCGCIGPSVPELEILEFVQTLDSDAEGSNRSIIAPFELDVVSKRHRIAVEFHGLYFHSDKFRSSKYHLDKLNMCKEAGYDLIQVFEDEWADPVKRSVLKSIISARFGEFNRRIYARNTERKPLSPKQARTFFDDNHIQGFTSATIYDGLFFRGELVAASILTNPRSAITRQKNQYDLELVRFVTSRNTQVIGGLTKLMAPYRNKNIVTYCDKRVFNAKGYEASGFEKVRENLPEYYYVKGQKRYSRHGFFKKNLASKLEKVDHSLTEQENMKLNGYHRIYGCGTITFVRRAELHDGSKNNTF